MKIRHEINILSAAFTGSVAATTNESINFTSTSYSGSLTGYVEFEGWVSAGTATIELRRKGTTTSHASTTISNTGAFVQSIPCTLSTQEFVLYVSPSGGTFNIQSAKLIILQDTGGSELTASESQYEIGYNELGRTNTTNAPLANPKYWKYDSSRFDGTCTFYAECGYLIASNMSTVTIKLQESDGTGDGFTGWTDKVTIINAGNSTTATTLRSASFSPTTGRNYRLVSISSSNMTTHNIYGGKIIVTQTSGTAITKLEEQYILANTPLDAGTSNQLKLAKWESQYWSGVTNTYYHVVDASDNNTSVVDLRLGDGTQLSGSSVSSPDNQKFSTSVTMPVITASTSNLSYTTIASASDGTIYPASCDARSQSFTTDYGFKIDKIVVNLTRRGTASGNAYCKIYNESSDVPSGTALATSDAFDITTLVANFATNSDFTFTSSNQITLLPNTKYVFTIEYANGVDFNNCLVVRLDVSGSYAGGMEAALIGGTWYTTSTTDYYFQIFGIKTGAEIDCRATTNSGSIYGSRIVVAVTKAIATLNPFSWAYIQGG